VSFIYYAVQGRVLRVLESAFPDFVGGGSLYGQGDAGVSATFTDASLFGSYVIAGAGGTGHGALALAGQFSADGAGGFATGLVDLNNAGVVTVNSIAGPARYSITGAGVGTLDLPPAVDQLGSVQALRFFLVDPSINLLDPNAASGGGGALVLDFDAGAVSAGQILPQSAGSLDGDYALDFQFVSSRGETDWVGRSVAAGGTFTGTLDVNETGLISAGQVLAGSSAADAANPGRWTGSLIARGLTHRVTFYQVSASRTVFVDTDGADVGIGSLERQ
jgi:hypothetical protein